jgi:hypothetical protein
MKHLLLLLVFIAACAEPTGELVTCSQTWTCGDTIVADNSAFVADHAEGHVFCTKPGVDVFGGTAAADERAADIAAYASGFAEDCNGANVACLDPEDGEFATCAATCAVSGTCPKATAVRVRLN